MATKNRLCQLVLLSAVASTLQSITASPVMAGYFRTALNRSLESKAIQFSPTQLPPLQVSQLDPPWRTRMKLQGELSNGQLTTQVDSQLETYYDQGLISVNPTGGMSVTGNISGTSILTHSFTAYSEFVVDGEPGSFSSIKHVLNIILQGNLAIGDEFEFAVGMGTQYRFFSSPGYSYSDRIIVTEPGPFRIELYHDDPVAFQIRNNPPYNNVYHLEHTANFEYVIRKQGAGTTSAAIEFASIGSGESDANTDFSGDYNGDGIVDTADYTIWRDGLGGDYAGLHYDAWKAHYGIVLGLGSHALGHTPEPSTAILVCLAVLGAICPRRR